MCLSYLELKQKLEIRSCTEVGYRYLNSSTRIGMNLNRL